MVNRSLLYVLIWGSFAFSMEAQTLDSIIQQITYTMHKDSSENRNQFIFDVKNSSIDTFKIIDYGFSGNRNVMVAFDSKNKLASGTWIVCGNFPYIKIPPDSSYQWAANPVEVIGDLQETIWRRIPARPDTLYRIYWNINLHKIGLLNYYPSQKKE